MGIRKSLLLPYFAALLLTCGNTGNASENRKFDMARLKANGSLGTIHVLVEDAAYMKSTGKWRIMAENRVAVYYFGEFVIGVDLDSMDCEEENGIVKITLDQPSCINYRIDYEKTKVYHEDCGFTRRHESINDLRNKMDQKEEAHIRKLANNPELKKMAKRQTELVLNSIFKNINKDIKVTWRNE